MSAAYEEPGLTWKLGLSLGLAWKPSDIVKLYSRYQKFQTQINFFFTLIYQSNVDYLKPSVFCGILKEKPLKMLDCFQNFP